MNRFWELHANRWRVSRWRRWLQFYASHPSYVACVAGISAVNAFVPFFPVELFLAFRVLARRKEWWSIALVAAVASAVGAVGLAWLVEHPSLANWVSDLAHWIGEARWESVTDFVRQRGSGGLFLISLSFLPLPPAVVVCALAKVPHWEIALSIGVGNGLKYGFFSRLSAASPFELGGDS